MMDATVASSSGDAIDIADAAAVIISWRVVVDRIHNTNSANPIVLN